MDGRTFTASSAQGLKNKYDSFSTWSYLAGLIESGDKAEFAGKKAVNQRALAEHFDEDRLRRDILFLGIVSRGKPDGTTRRRSVLRLLVNACGCLVHCA